MQNNYLLIDTEGAGPDTNTGYIFDISHWRTYILIGYCNNDEEVKNIAAMSDKEFISYIDKEFGIKEPSKKELVKYIKANIFPKNKKEFLNAYKINLK